MNIEAKTPRRVMSCLAAALATAAVATAEDRCTTAVPTNHCMIGTWVAESTNAPEMYNSAGGPSRWVGQDMGENEFVFRADGTFSQVTRRESTSRFEHRSGGAARQQQVKVTSTSTGRWSPEGDGRFVLCKETFEMKMGDNAPATPLPPEVVAAETQGEIPHGFTCEGDRAQITLLLEGAPPISWTVRREDP